MNYFSIVGFVAGALQFAVAGYALRLNQLFGTARVGWSLFSAFSLLAMLHLIQSVTPDVNGSELSGLKIEVMYSLISLLLLTGMVHMETLLKERMRVARQELQLRADLESEVKKKTAYLTRAIEELQSEIDMRRLMEVQVEKSNTELAFASQSVKASVTAGGQLYRLLNLLKRVDASVSLVSDPSKQSKIAQVVRASNLLGEHPADPGDLRSRDFQNRKLSEDITQLTVYLASEQARLTQELAAIKTNLEEIIALQPNHLQSVWQKTVALPDGLASDEPAPAGFISF